MKEREREIDREGERETGEEAERKLDDKLKKKKNDKSLWGGTNVSTYHSPITQ